MKEAARIGGVVPDVRFRDVSGDETKHKYASVRCRIRVFVLINRRGKILFDGRIRVVQGMDSSEKWLSL